MNKQSAGPGSNQGGPSVGDRLVNAATNVGLTGAGTYGGMELADRGISAIGKPFRESIAKGVGLRNARPGAPNSLLQSNKLFQGAMKAMPGLPETQALREGIGHGAAGLRQLSGAMQPGIMQKVLKMISRPRNAMIGALGLMGAGGLAGGFAGNRLAQGLAINSNKQSAVKTAADRLYNMQEFFEKTATLGDRPTTNNFANYLDCVAKLNPGLEVLTKVSEQLRQHKSVPVAFRDAYPGMKQASRANVAARLVTTYLETRQQVADAVRELGASS